MALSPDLWASSYLHKTKPQVCFNANLYVTVHISFIHNNPKLEITQISFEEQMAKQTV